MNQKGFTLVELMGILVILGIIIVVTVPSITKTLKNSETNELEEYQKTVCLAAKSYVQVEKKSVPQSGIKFSTLRNNGYLSSSVKNPNGSNDDNSTVNVVVKDGELSCTF
jgi:type IV pilus assembly protein PilA